MVRRNGLDVAVGINPELQMLLNGQSPESSLALIKAYKAGAAATSLAVRGNTTPAAALERVEFWADVLSPTEDSTNAAELRITEDEVPSFVPFDPSKCEPGESFHTDREYEGRTRLAELLIGHIDHYDRLQRRKIATHMGYYYGRTLVEKDIRGVLLVEMIDAFVNKQSGIIESAVITRSLRQPDQDEHTFQHYLDDLHSAICVVRDLMPR
ncbi:MAG TPA: hypothetical protein VFJ84_00490 [Candidatus Saccharimonadales bacterium]|nr:hypothetical protein [Candidatus Saccharimonadales bacterium]